MSKTVTVEISSEEAVKVQSEIDFLFAQIAASNKRMERDSEEIDQSRQRTRKLLDELQNFSFRKS